MLGRALNYPAVAAVALALPVSVSAVAEPPVVDRSSTGTATTVSKEQLEQLPTSRDVRSILDAVPTPSPSPPPASSVPPQLQTPASDGERLLKQLWLEAEALGLQAQEAARRCDRNGLAAALQRLYQMEQQVRAMVNSARQARVRGQIPAINPALGVAVHEHIARIYIPANRLTLQNCGSQMHDMIGGPIIRPSPMPTPRHEVGRTPPMPTPRHAPGSAAPRLDPFNQRILDLHNAERTALGLQPFYWNQSLAAGAQAYADELARAGRLAHASREGRGTVRENLNTGMRGWNADQMMASWLNEKNRFAPGIFPNVCAGDWFECAHYTQIIWIETTEIGCGRSQTRIHVWLVCRYNPGGNKDGKVVGIPVDAPGKLVRTFTPQASTVATGLEVPAPPDPPMRKPVGIGRGKAIAEKSQGATAIEYSETRPVTYDNDLSHLADALAKPAMPKMRGVVGNTPKVAANPPAQARRWIDVKTGKPVASFPVITDPNGPPGHKTDWVRPSAGDPNRAYDPRTGRNFAKLEDGSWIDVKTGKPVASFPVITDPNGPPGHKTDWVRPSAGDPNRAYDPRTGRNFAREPVPPTKADASAAVTPPK